MEIVTLREFARRVGVSLTAVQKGVQNGRIYADKDPKTGRISGIDYDTQAEAWVANAMHPQKRPHNIAGNRTQLRQPEDSPSPRSGMPLAEIQRARELVKLQLDNVKLKEAQGDLVAATDVEKQGRQLASVIISSMYNIPDRISDELAGMSEPHDIHRLLLEEIDRAVQELRQTYA